MKQTVIKPDDFRFELRPYADFFNVLSESYKGSLDSDIILVSVTYPGGQYGATCFKSLRKIVSNADNSLTLFTTDQKGFTDYSDMLALTTTKFTACELGAQTNPAQVVKVFNGIVAYVLFNSKSNTTAKEKEIYLSKVIEAFIKEAKDEAKEIQAKANIASIQLLDLLDRPEINMHKIISLKRFFSLRTNQLTQ